MQLMVMRNGPTSLGIHVPDGHGPFQMLKGSPWTGDCVAPPDEFPINHAVLLVGWNEKYWSKLF